MRLKNEAVFLFDWAKQTSGADLKIVTEYREKYKQISEILDENPGILELAHGDLARLSRGGRNGRRAAYTSENLLRALIVHTIERLDFRGTIVRLADSEFLRDFLRLGNRRMMDFTFLQKAFKAIQPETWEPINGVLAGYAVEEERIDPSEVRIDTTVVESPIHYPTDAWLLWDSWRVLARLLREARRLAPWRFDNRFHDRKVKKLYLRITRYIRSHTANRRRLVRSSFRELIRQVRRVVGIAERFIETVALPPSSVGMSFALQGVADEIRGFLPSIRTVVSTAERANLNGETVPASDRVFSIFEPHTELIKRGKRTKPVEFGHMVLLSQTKGKFISHYDVMEQRQPDTELTQPSIEAHKALFNAPPAVITADKGFNPKAKERRKLEAQVDTLAIPRRLSDWSGAIADVWRRFRAGIEGSISVLKRAYRLVRCPYRGFKSFAASVGLSVFCHNLVLLARPPSG